MLNEIRWIYYYILLHLCFCRATTQRGRQITVGIVPQREHVAQTSDPCHIDRPESMARSARRLRVCQVSLKASARRLYGVVSRPRSRIALQKGYCAASVSSLRTFYGSLTTDNVDGLANAGVSELEEGVDAEETLVCVLQ